MKKAFPGHFANDPADLKRLWENCLIAVDANVLLSLYRYSESTKSEFLDVFKMLSGRLWIPHQVAKEYLKNRLKVISDQAKSYDEAIQGLEALRKSFENPKQHPFVSAEVLGDFVKSFDLIIGELKSNKARHDSKINEDDIKAVVSDIFDGKVGAGYTDLQLEQIIKDGEVRYENKIPPGFRDAAKAGGKSLEERLAPYGDYIGWQQLLDKARVDQCDVIYVTGDNKDDWWLKMSGKTLGPLPALVEEFMSTTSKAFYMYLPERFLQLAGEFLKQDVSEQAVDEVREARQDEPLTISDSLKNWISQTSNRWTSDTVLMKELLKGGSYSDHYIHHIIPNLSTEKNISTLRVEGAALQFKLQQLLEESTRRLVDDPSNLMPSTTDAELESQISKIRSRIDQLAMTIDVLEGLAKHGSEG